MLEASRKHQEAVKQSHQIKRINTQFTTPAAKEQKSSRPKSEAVQKLLDEKKREERQKREAEERKKRQKEKAREEREREEKRKNTFRIPKKLASEDPPSDAESFSSISSGDESKLSSSTTAKHHGIHKSSSSHTDSEKSHKSSSHGHSEKKDRHSHKTSEQSSSSSHHSSKHRSSEHSSSRQDRHRSETEKSKHHTEKPRHSSEKRESGSSKTHKSSDKDKSHGSNSSHSKVSEHKSHKHNHKEQKDRHFIIEDKAITVAENDSSGYITSPDISSEEEEEGPPASTSKLPSAKNHVHHTNTKQCNDSRDSKQRTNSTDTKQENFDVPVALTRHHLKPTKDRTGGSLEERAKVLEKLQTIRERMAENDSGPTRQRSIWGEVKKRRAKREKLDGDFSGSCMEKINYDEEEKPSLKRPEPKPEEEKRKSSKENKEKKRSKVRVDKMKDKKKIVSEKRDSKDPGKFNRFDEMHEKPKVKPKPRPRPPPVNFADLMKMAEQKQAQPVMVDVAPKKEKERRPLTQEELDRKQAREERLKTKDYKDWYKFGNKANAKQGKPEKTDSDSGGFLRPDHNVVPPESGASHSKPFSIARKSDNPGSTKTEKQSSTTSRPSDSQSSVNRSVPVPRSQPHPTRPGMIANKPQAMAQQMNNERKSEARPAEKQKVSSSSSLSSRDAAPQPQPSRSANANKTTGGNAWDNLFSRPEYKKMTEPSAAKKRKMVIDSEEEDEYDDEMDDFIDDEGEEELGSVSSMIQKMFGYDKKKYRDVDDDDRNMEVGFSQVMKEEARSARIGLQEDLEDIRKEQEELRLKAMRKKMRK